MMPKLEYQVELQGSGGGCKWFPNMFPMSHTEGMNMDKTGPRNSMGGGWVDGAF